MFFIELVLAAYILYLGIRHRKLLTVFLILLQAGLLLYFELGFSENLHIGNTIFLDQFSVIMALITGIIGSLICVYAVGYLETYHHHHNDEGREI
jgi:ech hydrogenase subunit A